MSSLQPAQQSATPKQGVSTRKPAASQDIHYAVYLAWSGCNYGGQRVAVLFGGKVYACRHCHKLAYQTQREQAYDRAGSRTNTIRKRLGWETGILNGSGNKSKGMHWTTYQRLKSHHDALVQVSLHDIGRKLGFLHKLLEG